jgi:hypothetical protein
LDLVRLYLDIPLVIGSSDVVCSSVPATWARIPISVKT